MSHASVALWAGGRVIRRFEVGGVGGRKGGSTRV